jgi:hypothetical protein
MKRTGYVAAGIASLLLSGFGIAAGQDRPAMPQGRMMDGGGEMPMMRGGGHMGMMMMGMADHAEGRIAFLKTELKVTDAQLPQWNAFAEALRANARRMGGMHETMMQGGMMNQGNAPMSAPDRLDRMERAMTAMLEGLKEMKATLTPLYAVLTEEQKKVADQLIHGPMGMGWM